MDEEKSLFTSPVNVGYGQAQQLPRLPENSDLYYYWAGLDQNIARLLNERRQPFIMTPEEYAKLSTPLPTQQAKRQEQQIQAEQAQTARPITPGEQFSRYVSTANTYNPMTNLPKLLPEGNFFRGLAEGIFNWSTETGAQLGGAAVDLATGNLGKGQDYSTYKKYDLSTGQGAGQMIGSLLPDIALAVATAGGSAALSTAAAGSKVSAISRLGKLAVGTGEATGLSLFGKAIPLTAQATRATRVGAATAGLALQAKYDIPEYVAGRLNEGELATRLAAGAAGGGLAAGTYKGTFLKNLMADATVNAATSGVSALAPALPGGAVFDPKAAWTEIASSVALGTAFGAYGALADARETARAKAINAEQQVATEQARMQQRAPGTTANEEYTPSTVYRQSEELLFGDTTIPREADVNDASESFSSRVQEVQLEQLRSIRKNPDGSVSSISDAIISNNPELIPQGYRASALESAAEVERDVYVRTLVERFKGNEEALARALELEPQDMENLQGAITNKWVFQAANGRGINGIEQRLAQTGLPSLVKEVSAATPESMTPEEVQRTYNEYRQQQRLHEEMLSQAVKPFEEAIPGYQLASPLSSYEQGTGFLARVPGEPEPTRTVRPTLTPADFPGGLQSAAMRSDMFRASAAMQSDINKAVEGASLRLNDAKAISELEGSSVASILNPNSIEAQLYRAEQAGMTPDQAKQYVASTMQTQPQTAIQRLGETGVGPERPVTTEAAEPAPQATEIVEPPKSQVEQATDELRKALEPQEAKTKRKRIRPTTNVPEDQFTQAMENRGVDTDRILVQLPNEKNIGKIYAIADAMQNRIDALRMRMGMGEGIEVQPTTEAKVRTAKKHVEMLTTLVSGNPVSDVVFGLPGEGSRRNDIVHFIAEVDGDTIPAILSRVQSGQRLFGNGKIKLSEQDNGKFSVSLRLSNKELKLIQDRMSVIDKSPIDAAARAKAAQMIEAEANAKALDESFLDAEQVITSETDKPMLYGRKMTYSAASKVDITVEHPSQAMQADEFGRNALTSGYLNLNLQTPADWRNKFKHKLDRAQDSVVRAMDEDIKNGKISTQEAALLNTLSYEDISWLLVRLYGPNYWRDLGDTYVQNRNLNPDAVSAFHLFTWRKFKMIQGGEAYGSNMTLRGGKVAYNPVLDFYNHNTEVPDSVLEDTFKEYIPDFARAVTRANEIAAKAGIENPQHVLAFAEWNARSGNEKNLSELKNDWARSSPEYNNWDESNFDEIRRKIAEVYTTDAEMQVAFEDIKRWANHEIGAAAYQRMMSAAITGTTPNYQFSLRNFPVWRGTAGLALTYLLDRSIDNMDDDETIAGIPGSVLKQAFGGGKMIGYASASIVGVHVGHKSNNTVGTKTGFRRRAVDAMRQSDSKILKKIKEVGGYNFTDLTKLSPQEFRNKFEYWIAQPENPYRDIDPKSEEYEEIFREYTAAHKDASVYGWNAGSWLGKILFDRSTEGVLTPIVRLTNDEKLLGVKSPMLDEIRKQSTISQRENREALEDITGAINEVWPKIRGDYSGEAAKTFAKSIVEIDRRMSALHLLESKFTEQVYLREQAQIVEDIKKEYFLDTELGEEGWSKFLAFQNTLNPLRAAHYRAEVANDMGIPYWELESRHAELLSERDPLLQVLGAEAEAMDDLKGRLERLDTDFTNLVETQGRKNAESMMPGYQDKRSELMIAMGEHQDKIEKFKFELEGINKQISRIDNLDRDIARSQSHFYLFRHRDGQAPYVLRLQFDETTKLPAGVRREYNSEAEARMGESMELRKYIGKGAFNRRKFLMSEIEKINEKPKQTKSDIKKLEAYEKEINYIDSVPDVGNMSDVDVMRYISNVKILADRNSRRVIRHSDKVSEQNAAARKVIEAALYSGNVVRGKLSVRAMSDGSINPRYIKDKGNASLYEDMTGNVIRFDDVTLDALVNEIDNMFDDPIDIKQLREHIEKYLTYRDTRTNEKGKLTASVYVDMNGLKNMIQQFFVPSSPNLIRRYNWEGYFDPDGKWNGKKSMDWIEESIVGMRKSILGKSSMVATRRVTQKLRDKLNFYNINNGTMEYLDALQGLTDPAYSGMSTSMKLARGLSRAYSIGTLLLSMPNFAVNRLYGMYQAGTHFYSNAMADYGVARLDENGNLGPTQWMPSKAAADAYVYKKQLEGQKGWRVQQDMAWKNVSARTIPISVMAATMPKTFMRILAKNDPRWADVLRVSERLRLSQGSVLGDYAVQSGVQRGGKIEAAIRGSVSLGTVVDRWNNDTSVMLSAFNAFNKMGLTRNDWELMGRGNKNAAIQEALVPYEQRIQLGERVSAEYDAKLSKLNDEIAALEGTPGGQLKIKKLKAQIDSLQKRRQKVATPESILLEQLAEYMTYDRGREQGDWSPEAKSVLERRFEKNPLLVLGMTMLAPQLRAANAARASMLEAARASGKPDGHVKNVARLMKNYAPVLMGGAIMTVLAGVYANPMYVGIIPFSDFLAGSEEIYQAFLDEDEDKLTKMSNRQVYEEWAADLVRKNGYDEKSVKDAQEYVRLFMTEGAIRSLTDINISEGGGLRSVAEGQGFSMFMKQVPRTANALGKMWDDAATGASYFDVMYQLTEGLPSGLRRTTQSVAQLGLGQKLDKDGNVIIDPETGRAKSYSSADAFRQFFFGKRWSEVRSIVTNMEGGVPLYTPEDKQAWASNLVGLRNVKFGETLKSKTPGMREVQSSVVIAEKAPELQYIIRNRYESLYKEQVEQAKDRIIQDWNNNGTIPLSDGTSIKVREMFATVASQGGLRSEYELRGEGAQSGRELALKLAEEWGRTRAVAEAVAMYFNGDIPVEYTNEVFAKTETPEDYVKVKILNKFRDAYNTGEAARQYRKSMR